MLFLFLIATILPLVLALALPTTKFTEQWLIPRLGLHMMSQHTGLPGDPSWPLESQFNTTIEFDVILPSHTLPSSNTTTTITCNATFPNATLPLGRTYCTPPSVAEVLWFEMAPYTYLGLRRAELAFRLTLVSAVGWDEVNQSAQTSWGGSEPVTANDPGEESSYLTCLQGAPLDGIRCKLGGGLSVRKGLGVQVERIRQ